MPEVIIDGVRYVPARDVVPANSRAIKAALMKTFWGDVSDADDEALGRIWDGVRIIVTDSWAYPGHYELDETQSIDDLLTEIGEIQAAIDNENKEVTP